MHTETMTRTSSGKTLAVILGATAMGKTDLTLQLAGRFGTEIVSADSRQVYREMPVGTAAPTPEQLRAVPHHLIGTRSITEPYSCGQYETDALRILDQLFETRDLVFLTGGSGLYIDAVCQGMDAMPEVDPELRTHLIRQLEQEGLSVLQEQLKELDPEYFGQVDQNNPQRVVRALEVCLQTGRPFSESRTGTVRPRPFDILKIGIRYPREILYRRIDRRVELMMEQGLEQEARSLHPLKELNALQTVGYRELFDYFEGKCSLGEAVALIQRNSRRYAKRQETWFGRQSDIRWFDAGETCVDEIAAYIRQSIG